MAMVPLTKKMFFLRVSGFLFFPYLKQHGTVKISSDHSIAFMSWRVCDDIATLG